jgi:AcrR family transcriptional regulator
MKHSSVAERRERKDMRRNLERVFQAAQELFAERGADVTMEEIARRAGVGVGTIYRRFPSKESLFAAVSSAACADMQHCLVEAAGEAHDPASKLRALVIVQFRRSEQYAALIDLSPVAPEHIEADACATVELAEGAHLYATLHTTLRQVIAEGQQQGAIRQGDPAVLASLCLAVLNPRTFHHLQQIGGADEEALVEQAVQFVLRGLGLVELIERNTEA